MQKLGSFSLEDTLPIQTSHHKRDPIHVEMADHE